jgi:hypothetical protein
MDYGWMDSWEGCTANVEMGKVQVEERRRKGGKCGRRLGADDCLLLHRKVERVGGWRPWWQEQPGPSKHRPGHLAVHG